MNRYALILGANSDIAVALSKRLAQDDHYNLYLASRNGEMLQSLAYDLKIRYGVTSETREFDASRVELHKEFYDSLDPKPELVVVAFGYLGDQETAVRNWKESETIIHTNFTGAVSILNIISQDMRGRKKGCIIGITSVAGDRGRQSNYIYGSAKAGFSAYLSGLRNEMYHHHIHVMTVKPGFVQTKMIEGISTPPLLTASPDQVAKRIMNGFKKKKNIIYVKSIWRYIMLIIGNIPEFIFKRMKL